MGDANDGRRENATQGSINDTKSSGTTVAVVVAVIVIISTLAFVVYKRRQQKVSKAFLNNERRLRSNARTSQQQQQAVNMNKSRSTNIQMLEVSPNDNDNGDPYEMPDGFHTNDSTAIGGPRNRLNTRFNDDPYDMPDNFLENGVQLETNIDFGKRQDNLQAVEYSNYVAALNSVSCLAAPANSNPNPDDYEQPISLIKQSETSGSTFQNRAVIKLAGFNNDSSSGYSSIGTNRKAYGSASNETSDDFIDMDEYEDVVAQNSTRAGAVKLNGDDYDEVKPYDEIANTPGDEDEVNTNGAYDAIDGPYDEVDDSAYDEVRETEL